MVLAKCFTFKNITSAAQLVPVYFRRLVIVAFPVNRVSAHLCYPGNEVQFTCVFRKDLRRDKWEEIGSIPDF